MHLDSVPQLVPCDEGSGILLDKVEGSIVNLLNWSSSSIGRTVELPLYIDDRVSAGLDSSAEIEQVVVHVHGREREANVAYADIAAARAKLPIQEQRRTLIVSPQFFNGLDKERFPPFKGSFGLLVWKGNGWGEGLPSNLPKCYLEGGVSTFEALDAILCHFLHSQQYSCLRRIVLLPRVAGHSMGAQLVHRHSILTSTAPTPSKASKVEVVWVIMNPASYLYFSADRAGPHARGMNEYKYGFEAIQSKISYPLLDLNPEFYLSQMLQRNIHFLHGEKDKGVGDDRLEAMAQGADRTERARNYHAHLEEMQIRARLRREKKWTVDWVAGAKHDGRTMVTSNAAVARLFRINNTTTAA